jgi:hypothetical protein
MSKGRRASRPRRPADTYERHCRRLGVQPRDEDIRPNVMAAYIGMAFVELRSAQDDSTCTDPLLIMALGERNAEDSDQNGGGAEPVGGGACRVDVFEA